jgi:hypothetical protein
MWSRKRSTDPRSTEGHVPRLKDAVRAARVESAERSSVVVDLRDAELARLELLNEALDPLFADVPGEIELFDRGISHGDVPRLWVDVVAHVVMGRDKRLYRFVQDTRFGRKVMAESFEADEIVAAVTRYVARRLVERERALTEGSALTPQAQWEARALRRQRSWRAVRAFLFGLIIGVAGLFAIAWWFASLPPP